MTKEQTRLKLLSERERKLYIEDIPVKLTKNDFFNYFSKYGEIENLRVIHEKRKNGTQKNFAFILFKDKFSLKKSIEKSTFHKVGGFDVECKPTKLREELKEIQLEKQKKKKKGDKTSKKNNKKSSSKKSSENSKSEKYEKTEKTEKNSKNENYEKNEKSQNPENPKKNLEKKPSIKITKIPSPLPQPSPTKPLQNRNISSKTGIKKELTSTLQIPYIDNTNLNTRNQPSNTNLSSELTTFRPSYKPKSDEPKEKNIST